MSPRQEIRKLMRERRRSLTVHERECYARLLAKQFTKSQWFLNSQHIAFYIANDGELDVQPLMEAAWAMKKHCYLPILSPPFQRHLFFGRYESGDPLILNQFAIPEPDVGPRQWVTGRGLDLVLTPLVAFDNNGNRLGMGGGYYDKTFAYLRRHNSWRRPKLVGIAYDFQEVDPLDMATWDVPLNMIATPDRSIRCFGKQD